MARTERAATSYLAALLRSDIGLNALVSELKNGGMQIPPVSGAEVFEQHVSPELAEKAGHIRYPVLHVYCDKVVNELREKFRTFSGAAQLNVDVRVSHDHIGELQAQVQRLVEAVTDALDRARGTWGDGMFYTGGYEISFAPVKKGGRNFIQSAVVRLEVHISVN